MLKCNAGDRAEKTGVFPGLECLDPRQERSTPSGSLLTQSECGISSLTWVGTEKSDCEEDDILPV